MLKTRILTAVVLLAVFVVALFELPPVGWVAFATLVAVVAAWEWGGLMALDQKRRLAFGALVLVVCVLIGRGNLAAIGLESGFGDAAWRVGRWFYLPSAFFWLAIVPLWMHRRWTLHRSFGGYVIGLVLILPVWLAIIQLKQIGPWALIAILATVWLADIAAYFCGRMFGQHKLAPSISPGKTWEGAIGGAFAVVIYGFAVAPLVFDMLTEQNVLLCLLMLALAALSVLGDLFESLLKRQAGLKDSSKVLPGHGGVLDRIDSLTSTLPVVVLLWLTSLS